MTKQTNIYGGDDIPARLYADEYVKFYLKKYPFMTPLHLLYRYWTEVDKAELPPYEIFRTLTSPETILRARRRFAKIA